MIGEGLLTALLLTGPVWAAPPVPIAADTQSAAPDPRARLLAIRALAQDPAQLDTLAESLAKESEPSLRRALQDALARLPLTEANLLRALATSPVASARAFAAHSLGRSRSDSAMTGLVAAMPDADASVRLEIYRALGALENRLALDPLMRAAVRDVSPACRAGAVAAAEALAAAPTVPVDVPIDLARLAASTGSGASRRAEPRRDEAIAAARRLGESGDRRALEPLVEVARTAADPLLQQAALAALGRLGDARAVPPLLTLLPITTGRTRYAVLAALAALRDESSADALSRLLADPDPATRQLSVRALGWIGPHDLFTRLAPAQIDPIEDVRGEVLFVVGQSGAPTRIAALLRALDDPSPFLRAEAVRLSADAGVTDRIPALLQDSDGLVRLAAADAVAVLRVPGAAALVRKAAGRARDKAERDRMNEIAEGLEAGLEAGLEVNGLPGGGNGQ